ncbi:MAG: LysM peptidoglycan-binding domain-containing protein [Bacteroidales bacterium]|nr:LysM peptidoglycan-binding domain-containing protein [Bacteroidales bacterium]
MKNFLCLLFFVFLFCSLTYTYAQEVKKSSEIEVVQGKKYYIHEVQKSETLYSISKTYEVSVDAIAYENPDVLNGLKPGQKIRIPIQATPYKTKEYEIQKGETLYGIAKKNNTTIEELVQINPEVSNGIKPGQKIQIPVRNITSADYKNDKPQVAVNPSVQNNTEVQNAKHKVQKGETIYGICKQYNITQETLYALNPELKTTGLKIGQEIIIKKEMKNAIEQNTKQTVAEEQKNTIKQETTTLANIDTSFNKTKPNTVKISDCKQQQTSPLKNVKVALFIPLMGDEALIDEEDASTDPNFKLAPKPFIEFYEGFLMALDSIRRQGLSVELIQYEVKRDSAKIKLLLNDKNLQDVQLIIGPFYDNIFNDVAEWAHARHIAVINPISSTNKALFNFDNVIQLNTTLNSQLSQVTKYLAAFDSLNIVIVHGNANDELQIVNIYKKQYLDVFNNNFGSKSPSLKDVNYSQGGIDAVEKALDKRKINIIILPSSSQVFVINAITKLNDLTRNYKLILSYMPTWKKFEQNFELEHLFNLHSHAFQPFYVDYSNPQVKNFVLSYRDLYKIEPTKFSFLGYDCSLYFLSLLQKYGSQFFYCINHTDVSTLSSKFYFEKIGEKGGYENKGIFIIRYDDVQNEMVLTNIVTNKFLMPLSIPPIEVRKVNVLNKP